MNADSPVVSKTPFSIRGWFATHFARLREAATNTVQRTVAATVLPDPNAELRKQLLADRAFVASDGRAYPVGPCGYVPRSAQLDPVRRKVRS